jgi:predicted metalloprotease with PDZ domain
MAPVLPAAKSAFGGMPKENDYLVVFNRGSRSDGGAFAASYSMLIKGKVNQSSSVIWGHGVAHEVVHFWNGHSMKPASQDEEWLKEGFTDYFTILVRSRTGLDDPERVYRKVENCMRRYVLAKMMMGSPSTLQEAGHNKHQERMLVYGGGTLMGLALDIRIREATHNDRGIDEFLAAMFEEFGDGERKYILDDVIRIAGEVSGENQSQFFADYVAGHEFLDLAPYLEAVGLQLDTMVDEFYLSVSPETTLEQTAMRVAMFGRSFR